MLNSGRFSVLTEIHMHFGVLSSFKMQIMAIRSNSSVRNIGDAIGVRIFPGACVKGSASGGRPVFHFSMATQRVYKALSYGRGMSRVPPFYSVNGDARPTKEKGGGSNNREIAIKCAKRSTGKPKARRSARRGRGSMLGEGEGVAARELSSVFLNILKRTEAFDTFYVLAYNQPLFFQIVV
jgi:hypothetical protein